MQRMLRYTLAVSFIAVIFHSAAFAQCDPSSDQCVTSFSLSPTEIMGDGAHFATATITISNPTHWQTLAVSFRGNPGFQCANGLETAVRHAR